VSWKNQLIQAPQAYQPIILPETVNHLLMFLSSKRPKNSYWMIPGGFLFLLILFTIAGCTTPPQPAEIRLVEEQHKILLKYKTSDYAKPEYLRYVESLEKAKFNYAKEQSKFRWLRNYEKTQKEFMFVYGLGKDAYKKGDSQKRTLAESIRRDAGILKEQIRSFKELTLKIETGKIARKSLVKAEIALYQAIQLFNEGEYLASQGQIEATKSHTKTAESTITKVLGRYTNPSQIKRWQTGMENAIRESEQTGGFSLVINKMAGSLDVYQNGRLFKTYQVSIGRNGLQDKAYAGDKATPEGEYRIIRKLHNSMFHKALVINYPNSDDVKRFNYKKSQGLLAKSARIGGLIEIHGGGKNVLTDGCIGLDNRDIEELFNLVEVDNTVTIIGSASHENSVSQYLKSL
jgi:L,D-peptidoglycan transpeptidase YkuD (ErfK/YbiS/YcfS/YnhG family)